MHHPPVIARRHRHPAARPSRVRPIRSPSASSPHAVPGPKARWAALPWGPGAAVCLALVAAACATAPPLPDPRDLPAVDELYRAGQEEVDRQRGDRFWMFPADYTTAIETFQDIIDNYPYSPEAVLAELAIADAYFAQGDYEEALSYYSDFVDLHPEHEQVPYAMFRAAQSHAEQSLGAGRDQSATQQAIDQFERLLDRHPYSRYADQADERIRELRARLARHAMGVGDYYFENGEYPSAAERYRDLLNRYPGLGLDAEALYKLGQSYAQMHRAEEAENIFRVLMDNYGESELAEAAADFIPAAN